MNKLKTLKGLQKDYEWKYDTYNALRQEAINWIKELKEKHKDHGFETEDGFPREPDDCDCWYDCEDPYYSFCMVNTKIKWIKHFFNIKESEINGRR